jgi:hypothetical protein
VFRPFRAGGLHFLNPGLVTLGFRVTPRWGFSFLMK